MGGVHGERGNHMNFRTFLAASVAIGAMATPAYAQDEKAATTDENVIIVTAQRRAENVQNVPISITALDSGALKQANIVNALDLGTVVSNFNVQRAAQAANVRVTIRGIGAPGNSATEPSVATFLDGIYIPRTGSVIGAFLDIEGVEVLRGPQGTLFGRNASVGALSLRSAAPKETLEGIVSAEFENFDRYMIKGVVNVPLSDTLAIRAAGQASWFNGFFTNRFDGNRFGDSDEVAGRFSVKGDFGNVTWIARADYARTTGDGLTNNDFDPTSVSAAQIAALTTRLGGNFPDTNLEDLVANHRLIGDLRDQQWGISSTLEVDLAGGFALKMINSYRDWKNDQEDGDVIFLPINLLDRQGGYRSKSHNHELQLISPEEGLLGGALDFVAGAYYFNEDFDITSNATLGAQFCNVLVGAAQRPNCNALLVSTGGVNAGQSTFTQALESLAAYTQANINLSDQLSVVIGGRWTKESKDGRYVQLLNNPFYAALRAAENVDLTLDDDRFTYRLGLNFEPTSDILLFASYSTGFKSGGFNSGGGNQALGQRRLVDRETVENIEAGIKSEWFDRDLTANLTIYRMDISGYQDRAFDGTSFIVRNAGNLRHQGFEFDLVARPLSGLNLNASVGYLDSEFTSYLGASALPGLTGTQDLTGGRAHFAPAWTGNLGAEWRLDLNGSGLELISNANMSFVSDAFVGGVTDNNPQTEQEGYALLGARIALEGLTDGFTVALYGRNLTDEAYSITRFYQTVNGALGLNNGVFTGSTAVRSQRANPRTYGVSLSYRF